MTAPVSHRPFARVFVSGNKSYLYGYDVPGTSTYQKGRWNGISRIRSSHSLSVRLGFLLDIRFNSCFLFGVELAQAPEELK